MKITSTNPPPRDETNASDLSLSFVRPPPITSLSYILESTVFPREPDCLRELRLATASHPM